MAVLPPLQYALLNELPRRMAAVSQFGAKDVVRASAKRRIDEVISQSLKSPANAVDRLPLDWKQHDRRRAKCFGDELIFRLKVVVQSAFRDARLSRNAIDTDSIDAFRVIEGGRHGRDVLLELEAAICVNHA